MKHISALPVLQPTNVYDTSTGEEIILAQLQEGITSLISYCYDESNHLFSEYKEHLLEILGKRSKVTAPAEFARQAGIRVRKNLPNGIKATSRVEKLVQYKVISETSSYVSNPNPRKQPHSFNRTVNLGAVDKQMASLSVEGNQLNLLWKCWDKEYLLVFTIPSYILKRDILKYSLPQVSAKGFIFTVQENVTMRNKGKHKAGIDLGRVIPYVIAVTNDHGARVAHYTTSNNLTRVNDKRERLLQEKKNISTKINAYEKLGLDTTVLIKELDYKRSKITKLGGSLAQQLASEITRKLTKHDLNMVQVEDLRWVQGSKYGSRWNHSTQQDSITHSLIRKGISTRRVNPRNTSQLCHKCGTQIIHRERSVYCGECKLVFDRDFNAAMSIANSKQYPTTERVTGSNCSPSIGQVTRTITGSELTKVRKTTL